MKSILFGLCAILLAASAQLLGPGPYSSYTPRTRIYYIAVTEIDWNYAPSGEDLVFGGIGDEFDVFSEQLIYRKAVFREYTNANFTTLKNRTASEAHLGLLGPVIRGVVGDTIIVYFKNLGSDPYSFNANGIQFTKANEGALYLDGTATQDDAFVLPGDTQTYTYHVLERSGPGPNDPSSISYIYTSHVNKSVDVNTGLAGAIVITRADWANPNTTVPVDVDVEFVTMFAIIDEESSNLASSNGLNVTGSVDEANQKHSLNGYIFGNMPGLNISLNDNVRWYVFNVGSAPHAPYWKGNSGLWIGSRVTTLGLLPYESKTFTFVADTPGTWLFHCAVDDHLLEGMSALYTVA